MSELILDYAKKPPLLRRRIVRRVVGMVALAVFAFYGIRVGRSIFYRFQNRAQWVAWQKQEAAFSAPPTMVMASDDPKDVTVLGALGQTYYLTQWRPLWSNGETRPHPAAVYRMLCGVPKLRMIGTQGGFPIYTHERFTPAGESRIVHLDGDYQSFNPSKPVVALNAQSDARLSRWTYGTPRSSSARTTVNIPLQRTDHIRFFAGQSDPANPARFTFRYQINDQTFDMQGVLHDDGTIQLSPIHTP